MNKIYIILGVSVALLMSSFAIWRTAERGALSKDNQNAIIVGTNAEYPPYTYVDNEKIVGFDIDVITEVGKRLRKEVIIKDMSFDSLLFEALAGRIQVIAAGMTCTADREKKLYFTQQYISEDPLVIVTLAGQPQYQSVAELKGKEVVVNEGFTADWYMAKIEGPRLLRLATVNEAFMALKSRRADAYVAALNAIRPLFQKYGQDYFSITPITGTNENCALGISKKFPDLFHQIEQQIQEMIADGTMAQFKKKWGLV